MEKQFEEKRKQIIEELLKTQNLTLKQAKELLATLENYCELIINYTLRNPNEQQ